MPELPQGTVTLLFTDVEGSTRLARLLGVRYDEALAAHRRLLREAFAAHGGVEARHAGRRALLRVPRAHVTPSRLRLPGNSRSPRTTGLQGQPVQGTDGRPHGRAGAVGRRVLRRRRPHARRADLRRRTRRSGRALAGDA